MFTVGLTERIIPPFRVVKSRGFMPALTTSRDMSAELNVVRGPVALGRYVVPVVEQCVEGFEDKRFDF